MGVKVLLSDSAERVQKILSNKTSKAEGFGATKIGVSASTIMMAVSREKPLLILAAKAYCLGKAVRCRSVRDRIKGGKT